ncbi:hypothetical protein BDV97DRAFT_343131 [Delphinella strobiligena]|nr:hypothetical protein BDV97DRAFT_343131 [Delphinella strobiligena]
MTPYHPIILSSRIIPYHSHPIPSSHIIPHHPKPRLQSHSKITPRPRLYHDSNPAPRPRRYHSKTTTPIPLQSPHHHTSSHIIPYHPTPKPLQNHEDTDPIPIIPSKVSDRLRYYSRKGKEKAKQRRKKRLELEHELSSCHVIFRVLSCLFEYCLFVVSSRSGL